MYTRVLLGNLDIERCRFNGLSGSDLDPIARQYLWQVNCDFKHGTGHGVGYFLNVHEGPLGISRINKVILEEGMCVTNEPGYYEDGFFGIRIENLLLVKNDSEKNSLYFENVTCVPYERELLDFNLLNKATITFINNYHANVYKHLEPLLKEDSIALDYLRRKTAPL